MKTRNQKILDHPILGYFLLTAFAMIVGELGGMIDGVINEHALGIVADKIEISFRNNRGLEQQVEQTPLVLAV